jgi:phosphoribosylanthranilate isomerase
LSVVRSKICGITRPEDALVAAGEGADAIGLVFYDKSPRAVDMRRAEEILRVLPPFVTSVGLFVNAERSCIERILREVPLDLLQFHGDESSEDCEGFGRPYIRALRVRPQLSLDAQCAVFPAARGILLDSYVPGVPGGTGQAFDWALVPEQLPRPLILAGGLDAENVGAAIAQVRPYAVDVSGGVESAKGIKDRHKVAAFLRAVRAAQG